MKLNQLRYQDAKTRTYLGSPSITRLPDGGLLATHDYFGPGSPLNHEGVEHLTGVYRSVDNGDTWRNITHIANAYWSNLFVHVGKVYVLGISQRFGSIVIRRSDDGGYTWTHPSDSRSGLLFRAGAYRKPPNYHCGPMPVLQHGGRLYRAFEDFSGRLQSSSGAGEFGGGIQSFVISVPEGADLLDASSWTMSNKLDLAPDLAPKDWQTMEDLNWREGNVVQAPRGEVWNILRVDAKPMVYKAAVVRVGEKGCRVSFDPKSGFVDFPGAWSKFTIRRDDGAGAYWTVANDQTGPEYPATRNVLSLYYSPDLVHWRHRDTLLEDDSDLTPEESARLTGFQYADWQFDGDDIVCLVRTAYAGAHNFHDSNRITFHRIRNFRHSSPGAQPARAIRTNFGPTVKNGWPKETPQLSRQH